MGGVCESLQSSVMFIIPTLSFPPLPTRIRFHGLGIHRGPTTTTPTSLIISLSSVAIHTRRLSSTILWPSLGDQADGSIVSEYVPKGNLRSFMMGRRPFPWRLRLSFATDIARAIAYLHARDVSLLLSSSKLFPAHPIPLCSCAPPTIPPDHHVIVQRQVFDSALTAVRTPGHQGREPPHYQ